MQLMHRGEKALKFLIPSLSNLKKRSKISAFVNFQQKFSSFSDSFEISKQVSQPFIKNQPLKPRLENHFKENLFPEISILLLEYQIKSLLKNQNSTENPNHATTETNQISVASSFLESVKNDVLNFQKCLNNENGDCGSSTILMDSFNCFLNDLPTNPNKNLSPVTGWVAPTSIMKINFASSDSKSKKFKRPLPNPIDYTSVVREVLYAKPDPPPPPPFSPLPHRMPTLKGIDLEIITDDAIGNKSLLLSAVMSLQCISGQRAVPIFATKGDASKKIRAGMPIGAKVSMAAEESYHFLDKLVQCVFPRIREWEGLNPVETPLSDKEKGTAISFTLPSQSVGTFPDIEPHFDSFPRLFDTKITIKSTGVDIYETLLLLSGFQVAFLPSPPVTKTSEINSDDPWAAIKSAKTREERKALFAAMQEERRKEIEEKKRRKAEGLD